MSSNGREELGHQKVVEGLDDVSKDWVVVERRPTSCSSSSSSQASLVYSAEFCSTEILEPVLDNVVSFLANTFPSGERARVTWRWIGMFSGTCKSIHASRNVLILSAIELANSIGDAKGVSWMLGQKSLDSAVLEAGVTALLRMMPEIDKDIHHEDLEAHLLSLEMLDTVEDECLRIASWENGVAAVVAVMAACATTTVQEQGCMFLLSAARVERLRGKVPGSLFLTRITVQSAGRKLHEHTHSECVCSCIF